MKRSLGGFYIMDSKKKKKEERVGGVLNRAANGPAATREMIVTQKRRKKLQHFWMSSRRRSPGKFSITQREMTFLFRPSRPLYLIYLILIYCWILVVEEEETSSK